MVFSLKRNKKPTKWDFAHMRTAMNYANLSHAQRLKVGCVIVKDNRIISIGYNGQPAGWDNKCEYFDEQKNEMKDEIDETIRDFLVLALNKAREDLEAK